MVDLPFLLQPNAEFENVSVSCISTSHTKKYCYEKRKKNYILFEVETVMSDSFWEREQYAKAFLDKTTQIILLALLTTTVTKYLNARREQELLLLFRLFMYKPYYFQEL